MSLRLWDEHVVPRLTDVSMRGHDLGRVRRQACAGLSGQVLEIGFGSGLNVAHYPPSVTAVGAVEPSGVAWRLSEPRRAGSAVRFERAGLDARRVALGDASHDHALATFSLCTIPDPGLALDEVRRVLRPGGRLHLAEHGLAPDAAVRRWQHRLEPLQRRAAGGCHLTRDVQALLRERGWQLEVVGQDYLPGPRVNRPWAWVSVIRASC